MKNSRRHFIKNTSLLLSSSMLFSQLSKSQRLDKQGTIGIQLYVLSDEMEKDPAGTLKRLRQIGFTDVEHAGYENRKFYGYTPEDFKKLLADTGLKMDSGHSFLDASLYDNSTKDFKDEWKYTMEDAAKVGLKYVISPGLDESVCGNMNDFKAYMDVFNKSGELAKKYRINFAYHNEAFEFNHRLDNTVLYDLVLKLTDPSVVAQQMDIGNMYSTGGRAMEFLKRYPNRFSLMHVKDVQKKASGDGYEPAPLGKGVVGVKEIMDFARTRGVQYFILEEKSFDKKPPLDCARESLDTLRRWGY